jgi:hypothetical protein
VTDVAKSDAGTFLRLRDRGTGNVDAVRRRNAFQTHRDVDASAVNIAILENDVADVNAKAKVEATVRIQREIFILIETLDLDGAPHRTDNARKLGQETISRTLDDMTAVGGEGGLDQIPQALLKSDMSAHLVALHEGRKANDVCC